MKFVVKPARRGRNCLHFGGEWTAVFGALVLSLSISLVASEKEAITVKSSSVNKGVVSANAEMQGKVVQLLCYTSAPDCQIPKDGDYLLLRAPSGKGRYMDCPNIDLYEKSAFRKQGKKIGEYCLLGNEP